MFLVYVGGILILVRYCVMLIPDNKFPVTLARAAPLLVFIHRAPYTCPLGSISYGLLFRARAILVLGMLLYLVLLAVVGIVDYSRGMLKA